VREACDFDNENWKSPSDFSSGSVSPDREKFFENYARRAADVESPKRSANAGK
jgi:hypothetical protein